MRDWPKLLQEQASDRVYWADGAGNVFWLVDARGLWTEPPADAAQWARSLCSLNEGMQGLDEERADGLLFLLDVPRAELPLEESPLIAVPVEALSEEGGVREELEAAAAEASHPGTELKPEFAGRMVLFNADGSRPEACGNALRCLAQLLPESKEPHTLLTDAGPRRAQSVSAQSARVSMGRAEWIEQGVELEIEGTPWRGDYVSMGNPHFVLPLDASLTNKIEEWGPKLATHPYFENGVNVEFGFQVEERLYVRVWERGVGETQACGTGACAAAWVHHFSKGRTAPLEVVLPGGVVWVESVQEELYLEGPASVQLIGLEPASDSADSEG